MNTKSTADAVVRHLERSIPVYCVDAPFEGDVVIAPAVRTVEGALELLEDLDAELTGAGFDVRQVVCRRTCLLELRVRDDVGGWAW